MDRSSPFVHTFGRCALTAFLLLAGLLATAAPASAAPLSQGSLHKVYITDVRDTSFVVSWTTDGPSDGTVDWGTSAPFSNSTADTLSSSTVHYVTITGLLPATGYLFRVRSGDLMDDNDGAYYAVTTSPTLGISTPGQAIYGYIYDAGGSTPVAGAVVYLELHDVDGSGSAGSSQLVSARSDSNGAWYYSALGNVRTANGAAYFAFTLGADQMRLTTQGGDKGCVGENGSPRHVLIPTTYPARFDTVLDSVPNAVRVAQFSAHSRASAPFLPLAVAALMALTAVIAVRKMSLVRRADAGSTPDSQEEQMKSSVSRFCMILFGTLIGLMLSASTSHAQSTSYTCQQACYTDYTSCTFVYDLNYCWDALDWCLNHCPIGETLGGPWQIEDHDFGVVTIGQSFPWERHFRNQRGDTATLYAN